jgi:hypothetical protein
MGPHDESGAQDSIGWAHALSRLRSWAHTVLPVIAYLESNLTGKDPLPLWCHPSSVRGTLHHLQSLLHHPPVR